MIGLGTFRHRITSYNVCYTKLLRSENDGFMLFNFRPDRARQITRALNDKEFSGFERGNHPKVNFLCMRQYDATIA